LNGNTNGTAGVKAGAEAKTGDASNGVEVKPEVASPNGDGFRYNEYDGKA
jgi:hypothetical protein